MLAGWFLLGLIIGAALGTRFEFSDRGKDLKSSRKWRQHWILALSLLIAPLTFFSIARLLRTYAMPKKIGLLAFYGEPLFFWVYVGNYTLGLLVGWGSIHGSGFISTARPTSRIVSQTAASI